MCLNSKLQRHIIQKKKKNMWIKSKRKWFEQTIADWNRWESIKVALAFVQKHWKYSWFSIIKVENVWSTVLSMSLTFNSKNSTNWKPTNVVEMKKREQTCNHFNSDIWIDRMTPSVTLTPNSIERKRARETRSNKPIRIDLKWSLVVRCVGKLAVRCCH